MNNPTLATGALWTCLALIYTGSLGSRMVAEGATAAALGIVILFAWRRGPALQISASILTLFGLLFPEFTRLDGFWLLAIGLSGVLPLILVPATHWALEYMPHSPGAMVLAPPIAGLVAIIASPWLQSRKIWVAINCLALAAAGLHALTPRATYEFSPTKEMGMAYRVDVAARQLFPSSFRAQGNRIWSVMHSEDAGRNDAAIIIGEHGAAQTAPELFAERDYRQPLPWHGNEYVGNQYWKFATRRDGALISNWGCVVAPAPYTLLADPRGNPLNPSLLAARTTTGQIVLGDSDYWVTRLGSYQRNLLGTVVAAPEVTWRPAWANVIMSAGALASLMQPALALAAVAGLAACCLWPTTLNGNVRVVGPYGHPHDPARAWAVMRTLADFGFVVKQGDTGASLLIVAAGESTVTAGEKLVVAEPGARVRVIDTVITVGTDPLGTIGGIPDARNLSVGGEEIPAKIVVSGVTVIGTGSPSSLPKSLWQPFLQ